MKVSLGTIVNEFKRRSIRRRRMVSLVTALSMLIASGVVWELRSVGITMVNDVGCGIEEHVHGDECYSHEFICGMEESSDSDSDSPEAGHVHGMECFSEEFICEKEEHVHDVHCFDSEEEFLVFSQPKGDDIPVVNLNEAYIVDDEEDDFTETDEVSDEDEYISDDSEDDTEGSGFKGGHILFGSGNQSLIINRALSQSQIQKGKIYLKTDAGEEEVKSPFTMFVGETLRFCCHGDAMTNRWPFYFADDYNSVVSRKNLQDNEEGSLKEREADVKALSAGYANLQCDYCHDDGTDKNYTYLQLNVRDYPDKINQLLWVKSDGVEVTSETPVIKPGESITFCIYANESKYKKNDGTNHTIYINGRTELGIEESNKTIRFIEKSGTKLMWYQVTYTPSKAGDFTVLFNGSEYHVNVTTNFDYNDLYKIFWIKDGKEVLDEIPVIKQGESLKFCIYTDSNNTFDTSNPLKVTDEFGNKYDTHYMYANNSSINGSEYKNTKNYMADTRQGAASGSMIRRLQITYKFNAIGDYEILYNAVTGHKVHVIPSSYTEDIVLLKYDNTYINLTELKKGEPVPPDPISDSASQKDKEEYQAKLEEYNRLVQYRKYLLSDNYILEMGESLEFIGYTKDPNDKKVWFYNSYVSDGVEKKNVVYTNNPEYSNGIKTVRSRVTAVSPDNSAIHFGDFNTISFRIGVENHIKDEIYVVTNLGERSKDKVHERGSSYEPNSDNREENRYILYVDNDYREKVQLCIYTEAEGSFVCNDSTVTISDKAAAGSGENRKISAIITAQTVGNADVYFKYNDNRDSVHFYIYVRSNSTENMDHADIEIADGGYYEYSREVYSENNTKKTVYYEKYDTYINKVNECNIYGLKDGNANALLFKFDSTMYKQTGRPGEQQYELNSKQVMNGRTCYDRYKVRSATFDVNIKMILAETKVVEYDVSTGKETVIKDLKLTDIKEQIGPDKDIENIIFKFDMKGIVDALNKCSNHSGLDFNVTGRLNEVLTQITFPVSKVFEDENGVKTTVDKTFDFQLSQVIDNNSRTVEIKSNESSGQIKFSDIYVQKTSDNAVYYHYTISELNPAGSDNGYIYYDSDKYGIQISDKKYDVYVKTFVNSNNCMETEYYTDSTYSHKFDGKSVFTNKVYKDVYNNFTVSKVWSDGNDKHQGENISFYVYQTDENGNKSKVVLSDNEKSQNGALLYKDGVFFDGSNQNWNVTIENLPYRQGLHTYTYSVEEINIRDGYEPDYSYNNSNTSCTVTNFGSDGSYLNIQKIWKDESGNVINDFSNFSIEAVNMNLKRKYAETIPVKVVLRESSNRNPIYCERMIQVYRNNSNNLGNPVDFSFKINPEDMMNYITIATNNNNMTAKKENELIKVTFSTNAKVSEPIIYLNISNSLVYHWDFNGASVNNNTVTLNANYNTYWSVNDDSIKLGGAYSTYHSTNNVKDKIEALKIFNRTKKWQGARLKVKFDFTSVIARGKTCHITAYMCFDNRYEDGSKDSNNNAISTTINPTNIKLKISLNYGKDGNNNGRFKTVSSVDVTGRPGQWVKLEGDVTIPSDADINDSYFIFESEETNTTDSGKCVNLYLDDVVINGAYVMADVSAPNGTITYSSSFEPALLDIANSDNLYSNDTSFSVPVTLSKENSWKVKLDTRNLGEVNNVRYRYYLEEERLSGYKIPVYEDVNVSSNTSSKPMKVINQKAVDYRLPATGGTGPEKFQRAGLILIFFASAGFVIRRRVKRRSG